MEDKMMEIYHRSPKFVQTLCINAYEFREWKLRKSKEFNNCLKFLIRTEKWNRQEFIHYQNKNLRNILQYAIKHVPFYHDFYKKNKVDMSKILTKDDLEKIPIVTKEDIKKYWNSMNSNKKEKFITRSTSGTTGQPLKIRISCNLAILDKANAFRRDLWAGYDGGWTARFVGDTPVKDCHTHPLFRKSYVLKRAIFPTYCLSFDNSASIFADLKKLKIRFIQCYPSSGYLLAKFLELHDEYFPLKAVFYSSEPLFDYQKKLIEERFKTKAFGFYAQAEEAISAIECENGEYHLTTIDGILEIINDDGQIVSTGEKGFTVATSFHNYAMPLIRYALNDYTGFKTEECTCGRTLPLIYPVETKLEDFIFTPTGQIISPSILTFPLKHVKNIIESQIIQKTIDRITVKIVKTEDYSSYDEKKFLDSLKQIIGEEIYIKIEYVKKIHKTKNHKRRFVINEIHRDYIERGYEKLQ